VLFLGNSLTAGHEAPGQVQALAAAGGVRIEFEAVTPGGTSLEDHWNTESTREKLAKSRWHFLVLQQGPSSRDDSRANLREFAVKWADEARRHGTEPAVYMVWPMRDQADGFDKVTRSYREGAEAGRARLLPVGEAWRVALAARPPAKLYENDGLHATPEGSYLAALVITHGLTGLAPRNAPNRLSLASGSQIAIPDDRADMLRGAAEEVVGGKGER